MDSSLLNCPFCGATPHRGPTKMLTGQDGEPFQRYRVWCPHGHASFEEMTEAQAIAAWNRRAYLQASAPADVSGLTQGQKGEDFLDIAVAAMNSASTAGQALRDIMEVAHGRDRLDGFPRDKQERQRRLAKIYEIAHDTHQAVFATGKATHGGATALTTLSATVARLTEERDEARQIVCDSHWMAVRYADGRKSYAPGMLNDALRKAYDGGWLTYRNDKQHDLDPQYAREGDKPEYRSVEARAEAAEAKVTALTEALKPFALEGMTFLHGNKVMTSFLLADIYRARTALQAQRG